MTDKLAWFTTAAQEAMAVSHTAAESMGHRQIAPGHLLIALWAVDGSASTTLRALPIKFTTVQQLVTAQYRNRYLSTIYSKTSLSEGAKKVLDFAIAEGSKRGYRKICTGHALLGLLQLRDVALDAFLERIDIGGDGLWRATLNTIKVYSGEADHVVSVNASTGGFLGRLSWAWRQFNGRPTSSSHPPSVQSGGAVPADLQSVVGALTEHEENAWLYDYNANKAERIGNTADAIDAYTTLIRLRPQSPLYYCKRGVVRLKTEQYELALEDLTKVIELTPKDCNAYLNRGIANYKMRRYDDALADFAEGYRLNPQNYDFLSLSGSCYVEQKHFDAALEKYAEIERLDPTYFCHYINRASLYMEAERRDLARAEQDLLEARRLDPNSATVFSSYAWWFYLKGDLVNTIKDAEKSIALDPARYSPYHTMACALRDQGKLAEALAAFKQARDRWPRHPSERFTPYYEETVAFIAAHDNDGQMGNQANAD